MTTDTKSEFLQERRRVLAMMKNMEASKEVKVIERNESIRKVFTKIWRVLKGDRRGSFESVLVLEEGGQWNLL